VFQIKIAKRFLAYWDNHKNTLEVLEFAIWSVQKIRVNHRFILHAQPFYMMYFTVNNLQTQHSKLLALWDRNPIQPCLCNI